MQCKYHYIVREIRNKEDIIMGFMDGLGNVLGGMAAKAQTLQSYKLEYESMSDSELKREYQDLRKRGGTEARDRLIAVKSVLQDRGYGQSYYHSFRRIQIVGFFDSFKKGFEDASKKENERQRTSSYRTVKQRDSEHFNELNRESDSILLNKMKSAFISDEDKRIIDGILRSRGYQRAANGTYHR